MDMEKKNRNTRILLCLAALLLAAVPSCGQKRHHDEAVYQQFQYMEAVNGSPSGTEWLFHPNYRDAAPALGAKAVHRMLFNAYVSKEEGYAETVDSLYTKRLASLLLETGDRLVDTQWLTEGAKIEGQLSTMQHNIGLIRTFGGSEADYRYWTETYNMFAKTAIPMVREAYQPGYKRMEEYQGIYEDLRSYNRKLLDSFRLWDAMRRVEEEKNRPQVAYRSRFDSIAGRCLGRWKLRMRESASAVPRPKKLQDAWSESSGE